MGEQVIDRGEIRIYFWMEWLILKKVLLFSRLDKFGIKCRGLARSLLIDVSNIEIAFLSGGNL